MGLHRKHICNGDFPVPIGIAGYNNGIGCFNRIAIHNLHNHAGSDCGTAGYFLATVIDLAVRSFIQPRQQGMNSCTHSNLTNITSADCVSRRCNRGRHSGVYNNHKCIGLSFKGYHNRLRSHRYGIHTDSIVGNRFSCIVVITRSNNHACRIKRIAF